MANSSEPLAVATLVAVVVVAGSFRVWSAVI